MLRKTITYTDFNGEEVTEEFCFHLSKADLIGYEVMFEGGIEKYFNKIVADGDGQKILETFRRLVLDAYGERSEDGKRFMKSKELRDGFESSEAFGTLFLELATEESAADEFVKGVLPADMVKGGEITPPVVSPPEELAPILPKTISRKDALDMPSEDLRAMLADGYSIA